MARSGVPAAHHHAHMLAVLLAACSQIFLRLGRNEFRQRNAGDRSKYREDGNGALHFSGSKSLLDYFGPAVPSMDLDGRHLKFTLRT